MLSLITIWVLSVNIHLHFFLNYLIFPLMIQFLCSFYSLHKLRLSPLQASLHILIFKIFCTKSMLPIVLDCTSNMYSWFFLWSLKINIPLHKQSGPVGLFPVDVLNLCDFCFKIILYTVEVLGISDPIPLFLGDCFMRFKTSMLSSTSTTNFKIHMCTCKF